MPDANAEFHDLMRRVCAGSQDAIGELVSQHCEAVLRAVRRALPKELRSKFDSLDFVQGALGSFFCSQGQANDFETPQQLREFLAAIARNKVHMEQRRFATQKREIGAEIALADLPDWGSEWADPQPSHVEMAMLLDNWEHVLNSRCLRDRQIVASRMRGQTWPQIEKAFGVNQGHARRIVAQLLREVFERG